MYVYCILYYYMADRTRKLYLDDFELNKFPGKGPNTNFTVILCCIWGMPYNKAFCHTNFTVIFV